MRALWQLFISLKLTFVLLFFISIGAVIGMSYDQTLSFDEFQKNANNITYFFELYDVFHSWWFSLCVLLLAANLIACSIERLPRIFFDAICPRPYLTDRRLSGLSLVEYLDIPDFKQANILLKTYFGTNLARAKLDKLDNYYFLEKSLAGRFGVYVVHIALLIIMFSSIYTTQMGVDGHVLIEEGKKSRFITAKGAGGVNYTHDLGFYVGCSDFRLRTFVDNSPMEFESDLFIEDRDQKQIIKKTVRVNDPLSYLGYTFYQSSFRPVISEKIVELLIYNNKNFSEKYHVRLNTEIILPNGDKIMGKKIFDDFAGLGQALRINLVSQAGTETYFHVFRKYPEFDEQVRAGEYNIKFMGADQQYATGLSIGLVPGIWVIFLGFLILTIGLALCFFTLPQRLFARVDQVGDHVRIILAAQGFRNPSGVKDNFTARVASVRALNIGELHD